MWLDLSAVGWNISQSLIRSARARDAVFLGALNAEERRVIDAALEKLTLLARDQADPTAWANTAARVRTGPRRV